MRYMYNGGLMHMKQILAVSQNVPKYGNYGCFFHLILRSFYNSALMPRQLIFKFGIANKYNGDLMPVKHILALCQKVVIMDVFLI